MDLVDVKTKHSHDADKGDRRMGVTDSNEVPVGYSIKRNLDGQGIFTKIKDDLLPHNSDPRIFVVMDDWARSNRTLSQPVVRHIHAWRSRHASLPLVYADAGIMIQGFPTTSFPFVHNVITSILSSP